MRCHARAFAAEAALAAVVTAGGTTTVCVSNTTTRRFSLGGNLWPSAELPRQVAETGMTLVRLWIDNGLSSDDAPTGVTRAQADAWANATVTKNGGLAMFKSFAAGASSAGVEILLGGGGFGKPYMVPGQNNVFDEARIADAAAIWAAVVARMAAADCMGRPPSFIELSNEPNGHWNTYIAPPVWARLACAVRAALDARGHAPVGISGPGVSLGSSSGYLEELDLGCVALLSVHTWEGANTTQGPHEMGDLLAGYEALRARFDTRHSTRWVATEFGSRTATIAGHVFNHTVSKCYDVQYKQTTLPGDAEVLSPLYAARVAAFTLLHMNTGFDGALYWWVLDYGWSPLCFGLTSRNGTATAPLNAIVKLFAMPGLELPTLQPVRRTWQDDDTVTAAGARADGGAAVLWVAHAPSSGFGDLRREYSVTGLAGAAAVSGTACYPDAGSCQVDALGPADGGDGGGVGVGVGVRITLKPNAVVAVSFRAGAAGRV